MNGDFWNGKKVLLTGHTGFKGGWMSVWLHAMGARLFGVSIDRVSDPDFFMACDVQSLFEREWRSDIRDLQEMRSIMTDAQPDILIHMAAQPIVLYGLVNPAETFAVNVVGTANVLQAAKETPSIRAIINVTTDKVYRNLEWIWPYREGDVLGGKDPYSSSKSCADLCAQSFYLSYFKAQEVGLASVRAGNVIGGGDWAADRLVPDFFRALDAGQALRIRNPSSIRPWQHVLEPVSGYLNLAEQLYQAPSKYSGEWNFGPRDEDCRPVGSMIDYLADRAPVEVVYETAANDREAKLLKLDSSKAKAELGWSGRLSVERALDFCLDWHNGWHNGRALALTKSQIEAYNAKC
ncbi:CDP-glucose 4,6-dehydratase [Thalassospira sp. A3_1]|uniref:CDP-glucose 4,6-dehydratase n=1 Tax=Thalassospira sp. A3_1 TaxID=2821088 RepID=UPI001ADAD08D|nr:CDP-glucose 4,6-dehydratase [Thalassospira sp. A3_1]MBO9506231.1 CDP-glucose 4,6-dehydratase [Thalassospira sp. A3_1]